MLSRIIVVMLALSVCITAHAGEFPSRTVTIVSPYQAVGTSDIIARGIDVTADNSIALQKLIGDETQMWRTVISKAGIKVE